MKDAMRRSRQQVRIWMLCMAVPGCGAALEDPGVAEEAQARQTAAALARVVDSGVGVGEGLVALAKAGQKLPYLDLATQELVELEIVGLDAHQASFIGSRLTETSFDVAFLPLGRFDGASMEDVSFRRADLGGALLIDTKLQATSFRWCNLDYARFDDAQGSDVSFVGGSARHAYCFRMDFAQASFIGCDLEAADFRGSVLLNSRFLFCNLKQTSFAGAHLQGADLSSSTGMVAAPEDAACWSADTRWPEGVQPRAPMKGCESHP
ncbi:MAG: pentapeptide repeat-containing protein [Planctomycetota bacterium]